ncbi:hypothetical protein D3C81_1701540 [compost metagenome]
MIKVGIDQRLQSFDFVCFILEFDGDISARDVDFNIGNSVQDFLVIFFGHRIRRPLFSVRRVTVAVNRRRMFELKQFIGSILLETSLKQLQRHLIGNGFCGLNIFEAPILSAGFLQNADIKRLAVFDFA